MRERDAHVSCRRFDSHFAREIYFSLSRHADIINLLVWIKPRRFALINHTLCSLRDNQKPYRKVRTARTKSCGDKIAAESYETYL